MPTYQIFEDINPCDNILSSSNLDHTSGNYFFSPIRIKKFLIFGMFIKGNTIETVFKKYSLTYCKECI